MKKFKLRDVKIQKVDPGQLNDRLLLINLYLTQGLTLFIGLVILIFQKRNPIHLFNFPKSVEFLYWGAGLAAVMFVADMLLSRFISEESMDDGGINSLLFRNRPIWHIAVISAIVAICEELLFRGRFRMASARIGRVSCSPRFMSGICGTGFQRHGCSQAATV